MKTAVKFLKDYKSYKAGEVAYLPSAVVSKFINDGIIKTLNSSAQMVTNTITKVI